MLRRIRILLWAMTAVSSISVMVSSSPLHIATVLRFQHILQQPDERLAPQINRLEEVQDVCDEVLYICQAPYAQLAPQERGGALEEGRGVGDLAR